MRVDSWVEPCYRLVGEMEVLEVDDRRNEQALAEGPRARRRKIEWRLLPI